jgi:hypothetical protein
MKEFRKPLLREVAVDITESRKAFAGNEREMTSNAMEAHQPSLAVFNQAAFKNHHQRDETPASFSVCA